MTTITQNGWTWRVPRGDSRTATFRAVDADVPLDLTGYTVVLTVRQAIGGTVALDSTGTVSGTTATLTLDPLETAAMVPGRYYAAITATKNGAPGPWTTWGYLVIEAHA